MQEVLYRVLDLSDIFELVGNEPLSCLAVVWHSFSQLFCNEVPQFFIVLDNHAKKSFDGNYAAFGQVVEGMDVVDDIAECLYQHAIDTNGFVEDKDAIKISYAKIINYTKAE